MFNIRRRKHGAASSPNEAENFEEMHRQFAMTILFTARFIQTGQRLIKSSKAELSEAQLLAISPLLKPEITPSLRELVSHALSHNFITRDEAHQLLDSQAITLETTG